MKRFERRRPGRTWASCGCTVALLAATLVVGCGEADEDQGLAIEVAGEPIINGDAIIDQSPFVRVNGNCSGVLLDCHHVLTAAHCVKDGVYAVGYSSKLFYYSGSDTPSYWSQIRQTADDIVGMAMSPSRRVYTWYNDGRVVAGASDDENQELTGSKRPYRYTIPGGRSPGDIVAMAISNDSEVFAWYSDRKVSRGTTWDLGKYDASLDYDLPGSYQPQDIVGIAIATNNTVITWYRDKGAGLVASKGSATHLGSIKTYPYSLGGRPENAVVDMAINKASNRTYTYFKDTGTTNHPERVLIQLSGLRDNATVVSKNSVADLAMIRTTSCFSSPHGPQGGYAWPAMPTVNAAQTVGEEVECIGYGYVSINRRSDSLRVGDRIPVDDVEGYPWRSEFDDLLVLVPPRDSQIPYRGDSGAGCFMRDSAGDLIHIGTATDAAPDAKSAKIVSSHTNRIWITNLLAH